MIAETSYASSGPRPAQTKMAVCSLRETWEALSPRCFRQDSEGLPLQFCCRTRERVKLRETLAGANLSP